MRHPDTPQQELLTIDEAVAFLRISRPTMYRLIRQGDIKTVRVGDRQRIRMSAINAYLDRD